MKRKVFAKTKIQRTKTQNKNQSETGTGIVGSPSVPFETMEEEPEASSMLDELDEEDSLEEEEEEEVKASPTRVGKAKPGAKAAIGSGSGALGKKVVGGKEKKREPRRGQGRFSEGTKMGFLLGLLTNTEEPLTISEIQEAMAEAGYPTKSARTMLTHFLAAGVRVKEETVERQGRKFRGYRIDS